MRRLLLWATLLCCVLSAVPAHAATAVVQRKNNSAGSASSLATGNFSTSPAVNSLIVVLIQGQGVGVTSVTDTIGNTYHATTSTTFAPGVTSNQHSIYYATNTTASTDSVTVTYAGTSTYSSITAYEVSGAATASPFVDDSTGEMIATTIATSNVNVSAQNVIIFTIFESNYAGANAETPTPFTGYTLAKSDTLGYVWDGYHNGVTGAEPAGATVSGADGADIIAAAFKVASASAGQSKLLLLGAP
jgi:hypothetical protein